jgi:hypothetical protein
MIELQYVAASRDLPLVGLFEGNVIHNFPVVLYPSLDWFIYYVFNQENPYIFGENHGFRLRCSLKASPFLVPCPVSTGASLFGIDMMGLHHSVESDLDIDQDSVRRVERLRLVARQRNGGSMSTLDE